MDEVQRGYGIVVMPKVTMTEIAMPKAVSTKRWLAPIIYYRRQIIACMLLSLLFISMIAFCATDADVNGATGMVKTIFGLIDDIFDIAGMKDLSNLLIVDFSGSTLKAGGITFTSLSGVISTMHKTFQNLGVILLIIFFGVGVLESLSFQQMYIEKMVRQFIFLCIGIVLVSKSMDLVYGIGNVFSALIQKIVDNASVSNKDMSSDIMTLKKAIYDACNVSTGSGLKATIVDAVSNMATAVSYLIQLFIPSLIARLAGVVVSVMCWSRFIELTIMAIVSPITVCDISTGAGMNSNAVRGVKNVMSLALSGAIIMLSVIICQQIQFGILSANVLDGANFMSCVWKEIVVSIVEVGLVVKAPGIAKQVMGMA